MRPFRKTKQYLLEPNRNSTVQTGTSDTDTSLKEFGVSQILPHHYFLDFSISTPLMSSFVPS